MPVAVREFFLQDEIIGVPQPHAPNARRARHPPAGCHARAEMVLGAGGQLCATVPSGRRNASERPAAAARRVRDVAGLAEAGPGSATPATGLHAKMLNPRGPRGGRSRCAARWRHPRTYRAVLAAGGQQVGRVAVPASSLARRLGSSTRRSSPSGEPGALGTTRPTFQAMQFVPPSCPGSRCRVTPSAAAEEVHRPGGARGGERRAVGRPREIYDIVIERRRPVLGEVHAVVASSEVASSE